MSYGNPALVDRLDRPNGVDPLLDELVRELEVDRDDPQPLVAVIRNVSPTDHDGTTVTNTSGS